MYRRRPFPFSLSDPYFLLPKPPALCKFMVKIRILEKK